MLPFKNCKSPLKIFYEDRLCMKSSSLEALSAKGVFQIQPPICGVNLSNDIWISHIT